jgi:hypothetical protein
VLLRLSDHIRVCYERAENAERCATAEPENRAFHLELAKRWALLARAAKNLLKAWSAFCSIWRDQA